MMKKIVLVLVTIALLCGCNREKIIVNDINIVSSDVDMSYYNGISNNHCFKRIDYSELFRAFEEKGSGIFYLGYEGCIYCQSMIQYLNEVALENDVEIYYIDAYYNNREMLKKEILDKYIEYMSDYLPEDDDGKKKAKTPHVFVLINGEIKASQISANPWNVEAPKQSEIKNLKKRYTKMIKLYKDYLR